ncbi:MAG: cation:proton antiporter [Solobacterium sp.]|nr:cation:proton antiporter [Solobacterium sp.]MDD5842196.1 cation:proton antiporter [Solobacterium sp.]MDD6834330.1 cation:proton antiporter [Solobacterium sp.]MDY4641208.1 cation:proton antiporter [Erysipelotrichaceae bacterium]
MSTILISLSLALIFGLVMSRAAKLFNLPAVTSYLIGGLLLGPYAIGAFGIPGIGFNSLEDLNALAIVTQVALGFIAFLIGNEFRVKDLKVMGRQAIIVGIAQAVITTLIVDAGIIVLHFAFPELISLSSAIVLGAIAAATAPAATLMVVKQYKAKGPLTKLLLMVVAIDDAVGLIVFALSFGIATALESGAISLVSVLVEPILEILLSVILGAVLGWALNAMEIYFHSRSKRLSVAVAFVILTVGVASLEFEIAGVKCGFSLLLACMILGAVFCNICEASEELMDRTDRWSSPVNILFFVLSGAELDLKIIANPMVLIIGLVYIALRSFGKIFGAFISAKATNCSKEIQEHLGITLLPQAGVALGMALQATALNNGAVVRNVILFSVLVYELVGPNLTKRSLVKAGEIDLRVEAKINSRVKNSEQSGLERKSS